MTAAQSGVCAATSSVAVRRAPIALGQRASLWVSAGVVAHVLWTSAAPAMAYRLYAQEWQLSHTVTAGIFAIYPVVVVAVLIGFGDISDHIGRRPTMLVGLAASLAGSLLFALAPGVLWLFAGRALMGVGVGLTAGPATAAVVEFAGVGAPQRAARITTVAQAAGFAGALLVGGALTQYAPWPTRLSFWLLSRADRGADRRDMVSAAPDRRRRRPAVAPARTRHSGGRAPALHPRRDGDDDRLYAWRAGPVAGRPGRA